MKSLRAGLVLLAAVITVAAGNGDKLKEISARHEKTLADIKMALINQDVDIQSRTNQIAKLAAAANADPAGGMGKGPASFDWNRWDAERAEILKSDATDRLEKLKVFYEKEIAAGYKAMDARTLHLKRQEEVLKALKNGEAPKTVAETKPAKKPEPSANEVARPLPPPERPVIGAGEVLEFAGWELARTRILQQVFAKGELRNGGAEDLADLTMKIIYLDEMGAEVRTSPEWKRERLAKGEKAVFSVTTMRCPVFAQFRIPITYTAGGKTVTEEFTGANPVQPPERKYTKLVKGEARVVLEAVKDEAKGRDVLMTAKLKNWGEMTAIHVVVEFDFLENGKSLKKAAYAHPEPLKGGETAAFKLTVEKCPNYAVYRTGIRFDTEGDAAAPAETAEKKPAPGPAPKDGDLVIDKCEFEQDDKNGQTRVRLLLKNNGAKVLKKITITLTFYDGAGQEMARFPAPLSSEIGPGASKKCTMVMPQVKGFARYETGMEFVAGAPAPAPPPPPTDDPTEGGGAL
ncbi:MAG: hypothetical protein V1809_02135 [Planctomycetota bacterium]